MDGQNQPTDETPHLAPALTALMLGLAAMAAFGFYARSVEHRSITSIAADASIIERDGKLSALTNQGTALQQAAIEADCLLPIYGSSELKLQVPYTRPFHPTTLFHNHPTGFTIFPVGGPETTCLIMLQKLAAVGPALHGRKVAISLSPFWFYKRLSARADSYAGNFSALHAGELVFNTRLSLQLRQDAARRMLQFPATVANRPLLKLTLEKLADGSPESLAWYGALLPLGYIHNALLRSEDHWNAVSYLWQHPQNTSPPFSPHSGQQLDWPALHQEADASYRPHSTNNEFGLDNETWESRLRQEMLRQKNSQSSATFLGALERNREWVDLELLLRELTELGAQPLLLSMPIHGGWYDQCGVPYAARLAYYKKLRGLSARYHTAVIDFADHDADQYFCHDHMGHLAPTGLVYYSQVLDGFFHGESPSQCELPTSAPGSELPTRVSTTRAPQQSVEPGSAGRTADPTVR